VADSKNLIVGFMGLAGRPLLIDGKQFNACIASELGVHPDFRRQGVFVTLGRFITNEAAKKGIAFCYGFPNEIARLGHMKYGWFDVCLSVPVFVKYLTAKGLFKSRTVRKILNKFKFSDSLVNNILTKSIVEHCILRMINQLCKFRFKLPEQGKSKPRLALISRFTSVFDDFWKNAWTDRRIAIKRDCKYLNWRFFQKPLGKYKVLIAKRKSVVIGYICVIIAHVKEQKVGYIADFLTLPNEETTFNIILDKAVSYCKRQKVDAIGCWFLGNERYLKILKRNAFLKSSSGMRLIARINCREMENYRPILQNGANWYITLADADFDLSI
jgi:GNAT superfamily N-acetyltransferase